MKINYTARPEVCLETVAVTTGGNSALWGIKLQFNTKYVLRLRTDGSLSSISSCGSWKPYYSLSPVDNDLVAMNVSGRCRPTSCTAVQCKVGSICRDGKCIAIFPAFCPRGTFRLSGKRVDKCTISFVRGVNALRICSKRCLKRACVKGKPCLICIVDGYPEGWDCKRGRCIR